MVGRAWMIESQFMLAVVNNDVDAAQKLLKRGVDADTRFQNRPAICIAVEKGFIEMTKLLLASGCSVNQYDPSGLSALHLAAAYSYADIVIALLNNRAYVNALTKLKQTPLHLAAPNGRVDIIRALIDHGSCVDKIDENGMTPLMLTCQYGYLEASKLLISSGANVNANDNDGNTPILHATSPSSTLNLELIKCLVKSNANVNGINSCCESALLNIIQSRDSLNIHSRKIIDYLIKQNCDLNVKTQNGYSPLHIAALQNDSSLADLLIRSGCDLNARDVFGYPALFHFAWNGSEKFVSLILDAGFNVKNEHWLRDRNVQMCLSDDILLKLLHHKNNNFISLKALCRKTIRNSLGRNVEALIPSLGLPNVVSRYLAFEC